jgi:hypothetical protein
MIMAEQGEKPKDLAELAQAAREQHGIPCPNCGGRRHLCYGTQPMGNKIIRYRTCRNCQFNFKSVETIR